MKQRDTSTMKTYKSDIAWSNKFLAAEAAAEVDAFLWGT
jgi:hypothetical protein